MVMDFHFFGHGKSMLKKRGTLVADVYWVGALLTLLAVVCLTSVSFNIRIICLFYIASDIDARVLFAEQLVSFTSIGFFLHNEKWM